MGWDDAHRCDEPGAPRHARGTVKRANTLSERGVLTEDDLSHCEEVALSNPPFAGILSRKCMRMDFPTNSKKGELLFLGVTMEALPLAGGVPWWFYPKGFCSGHKRPPRTAPQAREGPRPLGRGIAARRRAQTLGPDRNWIIRFSTSHSRHQKDEKSKERKRSVSRRSAPTVLLGKGFRSGGRPETPERNEISDLLAKWGE